MQLASKTSLLCIYAIFYYKDSDEEFRSGTVTQESFLFSFLFFFFFFAGGRAPLLYLPGIMYCTILAFLKAQTVYAIGTAGREYILRFLRYEDCYYYYYVVVTWYNSRN